MNFNKIYRNSVMAVAGTLLVGTAMTLSSCNDDDDTFKGEPFFYLEEAPEGVIEIAQAGLPSDNWAFGTGIHMTVRANGKWSVVPANGDEEFPEWMKVFPKEGKDDGVLRFYMDPNNMAQTRTYALNVILNGEVLENQIVLKQGKSGPVITTTADNLQMSRGGNEKTVTIYANYDWNYEVNDYVEPGDEPQVDTQSRASEWLVVTREGNTLHMTSAMPNDSGDDRKAVITIIGVEDPTLRYDIVLTQVFAVYYEDFHWAHVHVFEGDEIANNKAGQTGHGCHEAGIRIDECPTCYKWTAAQKKTYNQTWYGGGTADQRIDKTSCEDHIHQGWTSCASDDTGQVRAGSSSFNGPLFYYRYQFLKLGSSAGVGNCVSPKIDEIEGSVNATVSFNIIGHATAKGVRDGAAIMYVSILGPGQFVDCEANAPTTAAVESGQFTAPFCSDGGESAIRESIDKLIATGTNAIVYTRADTELTEWVKFVLDSKNGDAFFGAQSTTPSTCWDEPESLCKVKIAGMTKDTRIVFIAGDAREHTIKNDWCGPSFVTCRMYMDNFKVVTE